jgi:hypothetical protein
MLYQLPNGKVIEISLEDYLEMTDADFQNLMAFNLGEHVNNPFTNSAINEEEEPEDEEKISELPEVNNLDKLLDQDYELEEE